jgi:hypothetical protein
VLTEQWWRAVSDAARIWISAPQVIALRSARVMGDGSASRADTRREYARMVQEKIAAGGESAVAIASQIWKAYWDLALMPLRIWWTMAARAAQRALPVPALAPPRELAAVAARIVQSGLRPVRRRVTANAKRLRRRKPSR